MSSTLTVSVTLGVAAHQCPAQAFRFGVDMRSPWLWVRDVKSKNQCGSNHPRPLLPFAGNHGCEEPLTPGFNTTASQSFRWRRADHVEDGKTDVYWPFGAAGQYSLLGRRARDNVQMATMKQLFAVDLVVVHKMTWKSCTASKPIFQLFCDTTKLLILCNLLYVPGEW